MFLLRRIELYKLSGSPVPLIRVVCLIPFDCHILGTELPQYLTLVQEILPIIEYNRVHQLRTLVKRAW